MDYELHSDFNADGGIPYPQQQSISPHGKIIEPPVMNKVGYSFGGWYKEDTFINRWDYTANNITGNIILYAKWIKTFSVIFVGDGGIPSPIQQVILDGEKINKPEDMSKAGHNFEGWYKEADYNHLWDFDNDVVFNDTIIYAKWGSSILVPGTTLATKIQWLNLNATSNASYMLEVNADETLAPQEIGYNDKKNITIQLKGIGSEKIINISKSGSLFRIKNGVTLILDENITLQGLKNNNSPLITVNFSNLVLNQGAKITGNSNNDLNTDYAYAIAYGGGVSINNGNLTMNGGEISDNSVYTRSYNNNNQASYSCGGGV